MKKRIGEVIFRQLHIYSPITVSNVCVLGGGWRGAKRYFGVLS